MKSPFKILVCLMATMVPNLVAGQNLPTIGKADEIETGSFKNGVRYYLVTNSADKGRADFALVQKGAANINSAREGLADLPHFTGRKPYEFLAANGVGYSSDGYITYNSEGTVYRFAGVPVFNSAARDSTMLLVTDLMARHDGPQALVISGDIDKKTYLTLLNVFSLSVTPRGAGTPAEGYMWNPRGAMSFLFTENPTDDVARITLRYDAQRTPYERMNTPVPLVNTLFANEFGYVLGGYIRDRFRQADIPIGDLDFNYRGGDNFVGDEAYSLSIAVPVDQVCDASELLGSIMANFAHNGVSPTEFSYAKSIVLSNFAKMAGIEVATNAGYVDKCLASYLYGANLASAASINDFFSRRGIPEDRELILFNNYVSALLFDKKCLTVECSIPRGARVPEDGVAAPFQGDSWPQVPPERDTVDVAAEFAAHLASVYTPTNRVKIRWESSEPVTGGKMWTLSNGMKVVYRHTEAKGEFSYALMLRGGFATVPGLGRGESAFVGDMLRISDIAGMTGEAFRRSLLSNGIEMHTAVSLSDLRIYGSSKTKKFPLLLKAMLAMTEDREPNPMEYDYYRRCEALAEQIEGRTAAGVISIMDSIMCPDYYYHARKNEACLKDDLPQRAEEYFATRFGNFADGMLVIVGDLEEEKIKDVLCKYAGNFPTSKKYSVRPRVEFSPRSGKSTYTVSRDSCKAGDGTPGCYVAMSCASSVTFEKYLAFRIAKLAIEKQVVAAVAPYGLSADVYENTMLFPQERLSVLVTCRPCNPDGLPAGVTPSDPIGALVNVRAALGKLGSSPMTSQEFDAYRESLQNEMSSELLQPRNMVNIVLMRYSEGKNLASGYQKYIKGLKMSDVQEVLDELTSGAQVEYVIQ